uniref:U40-Sparatoxin-Hju1c_1 n=1 Tax=Heteropoda jugulans TaxID=1358901 RepID=A0A4Q8K3V0_9ARAC
MKFVLTVVILAVSVLVCLSAEDLEGIDFDILEGAREEEECEYKLCEALLNCEQRPGECYTMGGVCKCLKTIGEFPGWCVN